MHNVPCVPSHAYHAPAISHTRPHTPCFQAWRPDKLRPFPDLRFVYEEEEAPEEFFVPYVWSLAVAATAQHSLAWDLRSLALLTPLLAVGVEGRSSSSGTGEGEALGPQLSEQLSVGSAS